MDERKLLRRINRGTVTKVAFADLCSLAEALGFELLRDHRKSPPLRASRLRQVPQLQPMRGQAKIYQVRQRVKLIERYDLKLED